jgi:hypothetical protein
MALRVQTWPSLVQDPKEGRVEVTVTFTGHPDAEHPSGLWKYNRTWCLSCPMLLLLQLRSLSAR